MRQLSWDHRSGGGTRRPIATLSRTRLPRLTLGNAIYGVEANDDKRSRGSSHSQLQGKIKSISAIDAPRGDYEAPEASFSQRFHPSRGGLRPFASHNSHRTNRRWASTTTTAQLRIATARAGRSHRISALDAAVLEGVHVRPHILRITVCLVCPGW